MMPTTMHVVLFVLFLIPKVKDANKIARVLFGQSTNIQDLLYICTVTCYT